MKKLVIALLSLLILFSCSSQLVKRKVASDTTGNPFGPDAAKSLFEESLRRNGINYTKISVKTSRKSKMRDFVENTTTEALSLGKAENHFKSYSVTIYQEPIKLNCLGAIVALEGNPTEVSIGECQAQNSTRSKARKSGKRWKYLISDQM